MNALNLWGIVIIIILYQTHKQVTFSLNNDCDSTSFNSLYKSSEIGVPNFNIVMFISQDKATAELINLFGSVGAPMYLYDKTIILIKNISKMGLKCLMF